MSLPLLCPSCGRTNCLVYRNDPYGVTRRNGLAEDAEKDCPRCAGKPFRFDVEGCIRCGGTGKVRE